MQRFVGLVLAAAAVACGSGSSGSAGGPTTIDGVQVMAGFDPGPAPAPSDGFQVVTPIVSNIKPGASDEWCTWSNVVLDADTWADASYEVQTETGHHVVLYYTMDHQTPGQSRICTDADMATFHYAVVGGGGEAVKATLPDGLAAFFPKGAQMVINHHYVNAGTKVVPQAQSGLTVFYAKGSNYTRVGSFVTMNSAMSIPPGKNAVDVNCSLDSDYPAFTWIPHMHQYGTHITVDRTSSGTTTRLFDVDWDPSYMFHPPEKNADPATPYMFLKGDQIHLHCEYDNTTSTALTFGPEMCLFFAATVDKADRGGMLCDNGVWGTY